jgi:hypothetical protein
LTSVTSPQPMMPHRIVFIAASCHQGANSVAPRPPGARRGPREIEACGKGHRHHHVGRCRILLFAQELSIGAPGGVCGPAPARRARPAGLPEDLMYLATMFSYGQHPSSVGVTGIRGCMGVFVQHGNTLFAIHIPDNSAARNKEGADAFIGMVNTGGFNGANAKLYVVLNNNNRPNFLDEIKYIGQSLGIRKAEIARLQKHIGKSGGEYNAVCVLCERVHQATCVLKYKEDQDVRYEPGGQPRDGYYHNSSFDAAHRTNGAVSQGWHVVGPDNSSLRVSTLY